MLRFGLSAIVVHVPDCFLDLGSSNGGQELDQHVVAVSQRGDDATVGAQHNAKRTIRRTRLCLNRIGPGSSIMIASDSITNPPSDSTMSINRLKHFFYIFPQSSYKMRISIRARHIKVQHVHLDVNKISS